MKLYVCLRDMPLMLASRIDIEALISARSSVMLGTVYEPGVCAVLCVTLDGVEPSFGLLHVLEVG